MRSAWLSVTDAKLFRKHLRELRDKNSWTLADVSRILGCSRKTAWTHLQQSSPTGVKVSYADRLAAVSDQEPPWNRQAKIEDAIDKIKLAWKRATNPAKRRRVAWRLAVLISETATLNKLVVSAAVGTSFAGEPAVSAVIQPKNSREQQGHLTIHLSTDNRSDITAYFEDTTPSKEHYKGDLTARLLEMIITKILSWR